MNDPQTPTEPAPLPAPELSIDEINLLFQHEYEFYLDSLETDPDPFS